MSYECITKFAGRTQANPGTSPGAYRDEGGAIQLTPYVASEVLEEFQQALYHNALIDVDYLSHIREAGLLETPADELDVSDMDARLVLAILTKCVRAERFCEGALGAAAKCGIIDRCLERLAEIDAEG